MTTISKTTDILPDRILPSWIMLLLGACAGLAWYLPEIAVAEGNKLTAGHSAVVVKIVDGDTVFLDTGEEVRLTGIQAPKLPLGRRNFKTWPFALVAKNAISKLTLNKKVTLFFDGRRKDRHGRTLAHLQLTAVAPGKSFRADAISWVQGAMVAQGLARVYSFADNRRMTGELLRLEISARQARRKIWGHPFYRLRQPETVVKYYRSFQLVVGRVVNAASVKKRIYLNFGEDWRTDFTVQINGKARRLFRAADLGPENFQGRRIRVRGWVDRYNGPMIRVSHPEQIEILSD